MSPFFRCIIECTQRRQGTLECLMHDLQEHFRRKLSDSKQTYLPVPCFFWGKNIYYHSCLEGKLVKYTTVLLFIVYVTHLGSVLEGDTMPFTRQKIKAMVSSKVAFVTSLVQTTKCPSPLLIDSHKQPGDRQASVCCVMSTHDMHHFHHVVSSSVPQKQVEWCMMYSCQPMQGL